MKILFIVPGSGFTSYCGNCFRDSLYAASLRKMGTTVIIMPLYLPFNNKDIVGDTPLFFPATTFYAEQQLLRGKRTPLWLSKIIGAKKLLNFASSLSGTTSAKGTEKMTHSMITGDSPSFSYQIDEMMKWIESDRPDVIHLSSSLLIGIAKSLKQRVNI
ncbi:MAG: glycosyl transferase, partial [Bacteroidales bacterium]|nr:glycosyl transferase [Bacteroidales bacterium]